LTLRPQSVSLNVNGRHVSVQIDDPTNAYDSGCVVISNCTGHASAGGASRCRASQLHSLQDRLRCVEGHEPLGSCQQLLAEPGGSFVYARPAAPRCAQGEGHVV